MWGMQQDGYIAIHARKMNIIGYTKAVLGIILLCTFTITGITRGNSNLHRAGSAKAKQPPCQEPSPFRIVVVHFFITVLLDSKDIKVTR
jgi:hypothetical protein